MTPDRLFTPPVKAVVQALLPAETRAVGGAVRSLLLNEPLAHVDVDLATTATPDEVEERLRRAHIPFSSEGKRWGSIIAHTEAGDVDVTSLREDTYIPGSRYPGVRWTDDWAVDAARRDFTINAVYVTPEGEVFDPYGGVDDLRNGVVRFIGEPQTRLREDPLRLLRFFRFCGVYGLGGLSDEVKPVLEEAAPALATLSKTKRERELLKLQKTAHAVSVGKAMAALGVSSS